MLIGFCATLRSPAQDRIPMGLFPVLAHFQPETTRLPVQDEPKILIFIEDRKGIAAVDSPTHRTPTTS